MPDVFAAGHERGGRYAVRVEVPGYTAWEELGVIVEELACLVHTADLVARLQEQS
jgi:hypothetical protein